MEHLLHIWINKNVEGAKKSVHVYFAKHNKICYFRNHKCVFMIFFSDNINVYFTALLCILVGYLNDIEFYYYFYTINVTYHFLYNAHKDKKVHFITKIWFMSWILIPCISHSRQHCFIIAIWHDSGCFCRYSMLNFVQYKYLTFISYYHTW